jgi:dTDP-4-amino-4,6-dideoxygalactose transaminase
MPAVIALSDFPAKYRRHRREIDQAIRRVFTRGWFILGPEVEAFEREFAEHVGSAHAVGVNSGTDALYLSLRALGVGRGHEVITVANTATPTVSAIRMTGAVPVFVDIDETTFNMDPARLDRAITRRTRAIIPVHLFGYPAEVGDVLDVARRHHLPVVEDVAQATGAKLGRDHAGTLGDVGCFSFYPTKNLGAFGDGGAIVTDSVKLARQLKQLRNYGERSKYFNVQDGVNSRLDELQAALLRWGLGELEAWNTKRRQLADEYLRALAGTPLVLPPPGDKRHHAVWHLFVVRTRRRSALAAALAAAGVQTAIHYPRPICCQPAYKSLGYTAKDLPVTHRVMKEILTLPLSPEMTTADVQRVAAAVAGYFNGNRG